MAELRGLVQKLGLIGHVYLPGFNANVIEVLDRSDCFLLPSLSEGFGIAAVEAMARGLPVIVSNVGPLPELVCELGSNWIIPPTDLLLWAERMRQMADLDRAKLAENSRKGREIAESFSSSGHIQRLEAVYEMIVAQNVNRLSQ